MLVLLAAATVVLAPEPAEAAAPALRRPSATRVFAQPTAPRLCRGSGRLQTSGPDPALLYRPSLEDARIKKLIEMPMGEFCLLGGVDAPGRASR